MTTSGKVPSMVVVSVTFNGITEEFQSIIVAALMEDHGAVTVEEKGVIRRAYQGHRSQWITDEKESGVEMTCTTAVYSLLIR